MTKDINKSPLISVVIPSFNSEKYIEDTINSVLNQSYRIFEIIVVDDESTDNTFTYVQKLAADDERIKFYRIQHSGRPSVPRNYGVKKSSGSLIAFLDSDDLWTKEKLRYQLEYLINHPEISFVYSMSYSFGEVNLFSDRYELLPLPFRAARNKRELIYIGNTITLSSVLIRRESFEKAGGFDENPEQKLEDYDLWLRLSESERFHLISRIHVYYRIHNPQFSSDWDTREERLKYLEEKRNIKFTGYKHFRRKGLLILLIRNLIHLVFYLFYKTLGYAENRDRLAI